MNTEQQLHGTEGLGPVRQLGYVVEDIPSSINDWVQQGVGPWLWMRNVRLPCTYRGQPSKPVIDVALSYRGEMQIELIQQINDQPSPYSEVVSSGNYGLHHKAHLCSNIHQATEQMQQQGLELVCDIRMFGARYVYLQTPDGEFVELLPASLTMRTMFKRGIAASKRWQGRGEPVVLDLKNPATLMVSLPKAIRVGLSKR